MKIDIGEAQRIVSGQKMSGLGVREYCESLGLSSKAYYRYKYRVEQAGVRNNKFAEVRTDLRIELELGNGAKIKVSPEDLKLVLAALQ